MEITVASHATLVTVATGWTPVRLTQGHVQAARQGGQELTVQVCKQYWSVTFWLEDNN